MQLTAPNLDALFYTYQFGFQQALAQVQTTYQKITTEYPSTGRENRYGWIDRLPRMREWVGERQYVNLSSRAYVLANRDWEISDELDRNVVQDDQYGLFLSQNIPMLAMQTKRNPDWLLYDILKNGDSTSSTVYQGYDGQAFFSTSHPVNPDDSTAGTYSNLYTTAGSGATTFSSANLDSMHKVMAGYKGADGAPIGVKLNTIIHPPALKYSVAQVLNASFTAPAVATGQNAASVMQENVLKGTANAIEFDLLAGDDATWYPCDLSMPVKPFIHQTRQAPVFVFRNKTTDPNYFERKKLQFGADSREACGYSLPFLAAKCGS